MRLIIITFFIIAKLETNKNRRMVQTCYTHSMAYYALYTQEEALSSLWTDTEWFTGYAVKLKKIIKQSTKMYI